jgi:hypothetical protein
MALLEMRSVRLEQGRSDWVGQRFLVCRRCKRFTIEAMMRGGGGALDCFGSATAMQANNVILALSPSISHLFSSRFPPARLFPQLSLNCGPAEHLSPPLLASTPPAIESPLHPLLHSISSRLRSLSCSLTPLLTCITRRSIWPVGTRSA